MEEEYFLERGYFVADAPPQFALVTEEELLRLFPCWRLALTSPVRRRYPNPFTKEMMEGWSWDPNPEDPTVQPAGWAPDLSSVPRTKKVALGWTEISEFVEAVTGLDVERQFEADCASETGGAAREESPLVPPRDATWAVAGIRNGWVDAIESAAACASGPVGWQRTFLELKALLRSRRPGHRLVLVDRTSPIG